MFVPTPIRAIFSWRAMNQSQELQAGWMLVNTPTSKKHTLVAPRKQNRLLRLVGVEQYRSRRLRNTFLQAILRPLKMLAKPVVFMSCFYYSDLRRVGVPRLLFRRRRPLHAYVLRMGPPCLRSYSHDRGCKCVQPRLLS